MTNDPAPALRYIDEILSVLGIDRAHWSFIDHDNRCHGSDWSRLRAAVSQASFVLNISVPTWFDEGFIAGSSVDFGVMKHTYVQSRCGCFSDRSLCYMAAGRPVLHQDTGIGDWLPTGVGVLRFSSVDDLVDGLRDSSSARVSRVRQTQQSHAYREGCGRRS
jgi:hypothetical protein